jgi:geranylgeranyl diphosphate synthase, type II
MQTVSVPEAILEFINDVLPAKHRNPEIDGLYKMMRDYPSRGGKMIRSRLLLASCAAHGGKFDAALPLAAGLELFQNWVLVHDDIEDDSDERRGQPALHRIHGVPLALNAGDALHVYMWQVVHRAGVPGAFEQFLEMIHRTAEGQQIDLSWVQFHRWDVTEADYLELVRLKTAYYTVVAPLRLGALAAELEPDERFLDAGLHLGIAFQIRDDVLNLSADFEAYGKEINGDLYEGKRTLMLIHLLRSATPLEQDEIIGILEQPRLQKTPAQIQRILELMRSHQCLEFAQGVADEHAKLGLELLEAALQGLPGRTAAQEILATAHTLATRHA